MPQSNDITGTNRCSQTRTSSSSPLWARSSRVGYSSSPNDTRSQIGALADPLVLEFQEVKARVASALGAHCGSTICAFEHGPSQAGCSLGCGVDHAHLHLVPIEL